MTVGWLLPDFLPALSRSAWFFAAAASLTVGISKAGFSGVGMLTIVFMAEAVGARMSTGVVLPMLLLADLLAVGNYRQHADWKFIVRLLPPALLGVVLGWWMMPLVPEHAFRKALGVIILALVLLQWIRMYRGAWLAALPDSRPLVWGVGGVSGVTTMLANAAGPVTAIYFLLMRLPKLTFVGTSACFFLVINLCKVPFSVDRGLIHGGSLVLNLMLVPGVLLGFWLGNAWLKKISNATFERLLLFLTGISALHLVFN